MDKPRQELFEFLKALECGSAKEIYSDDAFSRNKYSLEITENLKADILIDTIKKERVDCIYISLHCQEDTDFSLLFKDMNLNKIDWGCTVSHISGNSELFWLPKVPVLRIYDSNERILQTQPSDFEISDSAFRLICAGGMRTEFCLLRFSKNTRDMKFQLTDRDPFEDTEFFRFHRNIFYYKGLCDLWDYLIQGKIYKPSPGGSNHSVQSQHTAYSLYYHMSYLHDRFGKHLYLIIRQLIAHTVLLSLDKSNRWRHGLWADKMETHCIFQASAIDVLVDYYELSGREVFLEKAKAAADYLVEIADRLSNDSLWFLHDTLELNIEDARLFYADLLPSTALGKSESNTLCLNSHLWTMIVLHRLSKLQQGQRYTVSLQKGHRALEMALSLKPLSILYEPIYWLRDCFYAMAQKIPCKLTEILRRKYESLLKKGWLLRLKVRHPRIVMPNGFAERDISATLLMNDYHLVNLSHLICLYRDVPEPWLGDIIEKCMRFTMRSSVLRNFSRHAPKATMILDILILYTAVLDEKYLSAFAEFAPLANGFDSGFAIDLFSNPEIAGPWNGLSVSNENVLLLQIPSKTNLKAILVNMSDSDQLVEVLHQKGKCKNMYSGVDISGKIIPLEMPINMRRGGVIRIIQKSSEQ